MLDATSTHRTAASISPSFTSFKIEVTSNLDDLADCWPTSAEPGKAHCYPFQYGDLLRIWCETIGRARGIEPVFAAVSLADGTPALLLPFCIERTGAVAILRFPDCGVSDYNAPVVFPAASALPDIETVWSRLVKSLPPFDLAVLDKMPGTIHGIGNPFATLATESHPESGHGVTLRGPWEEFAKNRLPRWRDSRRCLRNLEKLGTVCFQIARDRRERAEFLDALFQQKRRRFEETMAIDLFDRPGVTDFYRRTTHSSGGKAIVSALTLDGRVLAANWGLLSGDHYFDLMTSNEGGEFRTYAPGRLLNEWLLQWCIEQGIRISDFGIGDEAYKFRYCDVHTPLHDAYIPVTLRGTLYARAMRVHMAAKQALRDTVIGTAIKAARSRIQKFTAIRPAKTSPHLPAWIALIGSVSLAIDG